MRTPVTVGVVCGVSGLGATLARAFDELPQSSLRWICDQAPRIASVGYGPATAWTSDFDELLQDEDLDAVVFASSELAGTWASAGGARRRQARLRRRPARVRLGRGGRAGGGRSQAEPAPDGAFARAAAPRRAAAPPPDRPRRARRDLLRARAAVRVAGRAQDVDVLWDLGADTIATVLDLLGDEPVEAHASGVSYLGRQAPDVIFAKLEFATGIGVYVHLSCLEGETADHISVVGSEATAVLDATEPSTSSRSSSTGRRRPSSTT